MDYSQVLRAILIFPFSRSRLSYHSLYILAKVFGPVEVFHACPDLQTLDLKHTQVVSGWCFVAIFVSY